MLCICARVHNKHHYLKKYEPFVRLFGSSSLLKHWDYHHRQEKAQRFYSDDERYDAFQHDSSLLIMFNGLLYYITEYLKSFPYI